ncbi:TPA: hypothetical protein I7704_13370 [Vibrio vulnificus]|nr:ATP-binding protein [Vibrio vulnificus]EHH0747044.1 ATP-binding protein [Vibrio vulnificus]EIF8196558.1 AAA family ATPase [Vibrio vulnificus]MCU8299119.1 ATP-binding protein [Vibrio vulnificus]HAS8194960.1 hypothetical protein [Vibrio vulnificus]
MLLTFGVENFEGIGEMQYLDFIASSKNEFQDTLYKINDTININSGLCVIGPNGAGKSHLLHALYHFSHIPGSSISTIDFPTFILSKKWLGKPTRFEALYYCKELKSFLNYELSVFGGRVITEKLFSRKNRKAAKNKTIFERDENSVKLGRDVNASEEMINATIDSGATLIKFARGLNIPEIKSVYNICLSTLLFTPDMVQEIGHELVKKALGCHSLQNIKDESSLEKMLLASNSRLDICKELIKSFGIPIRKIELVKFNHEFDIMIIPDNVDTEDTVKISLEQAKLFFSTGTFNLIVMTLIIIGCVAYNSIILLDEIDSSFHHKLTLSIIDLLRKGNVKTDSQFVITTHDIMLLDYDFRRDAIITVTKGDDLETRVDKVSDYSVRKDAKLSIKYFSNEFGALPNILKD